MPKDQLLFELKSQKWIFSILVLVAVGILFILQSMSFVPSFPYPYGIVFVFVVVLFLVYELYAFLYRPSYFRIDQTSIILQARLARWRNAPGFVWAHSGGLKFKTEWIYRPPMSGGGPPTKSALWIEATDQSGKKGAFYLKAADFDSRWLSGLIKWIEQR